jgi:glycosyltransferase involved in cell wall biosynthesis
MKILFIIPKLGAGGAEKTTTLLLKHINRKKFNCALLLYRRKGEFLEELQDIPIESIESPDSGLLYKARKVVKLNQAIRRWKADLVVSHLWGCNIDVILATRYLNNVSSAVVVRPMENIRYKLQENTAFHRFFTNLAIKKLYPKADGIISESEGVRKELIEYYSIEESKLKTIYPPIDLNYILSAKKEEVTHPWFSENIPIIITLARLVKNKGHVYLIKAFADLKKKYDCRLVIVGQGGERENLERLTHELKIDKDVAFLGFQPNPFKYIARAHVFVLSSLYEGFARVLVEAMACNVPVVSTRCPYGPDEIIKHEITGLLVPVGNVNALSSAISRLLTDESLKKKIVKNAKKRCAEFDVKVKIKEHEEYFEKMVTEKEK